VCGKPSVEKSRTADKISHPEGDSFQYILFVLFHARPPGPSPPRPLFTLWLSYEILSVRITYSPYHTSSLLAAVGASIKVVVQTYSFLFGKSSSRSFSRLYSTHMLDKAAAHLLDSSSSSVKEQQLFCWIAAAHLLKNSSSYVGKQHPSVEERQFICWIPAAHLLKNNSSYVG
jgi:hypothetical protein